MTQLAITVKDNKNLFSNYYLDNQIKKVSRYGKNQNIFTDKKVNVPIEVMKT
ncbi:MAG: hypothetical protein OIN83_12825 [Candidatus Methanoperedens sp.]|nr:hypothetical protein [Candidatus Methanoperedens sp.]